jgi:hypothetical protein
MMLSDQAEDRLRLLLREAGVAIERPTGADLRRTWQVMHQFAAESVEDTAPAEEDGDGILAQYGTYDFGEGEHFEVDMTRQFTFYDEDGEYDHTSQLACTFRFPPSDDLRRIGAGDLWSFGVPLDEFFDQALQMPGFSAVLDAGLDPDSLVIEYGEV